MILLVTLTVVGFLLVMLRKEQGPESPQNTHDTIVAEKQQNTAITDLASEIVTPIEQNVSPNKKHTRKAKEVSTIKQSSSVVSDTNMTKKETKIHYNDEDSLFVMQEYARCKDCVDALKQEFERKMDELKEKQLEGKNVLFEFKWELEKFKNASLDCSNTMNRTIKEHLQHYADSGDKETYNYYSYELIKKMKTNTVSY